MDAEMLTEKTRKAIATFQDLEGTTFRAKKKSLNFLMKELQSDYTSEEILDFVSNLNATTEYDKALKADLVVRFQLEPLIWEILRMCKGPIVGKILKNWSFFRNIFKKVTVKDFVNDILPTYSYKTTVKVINVIGKNLKNEPELSDCLFTKLEETYGIKMAQIVLQTCSMGLIKQNISKFYIVLSDLNLMKLIKRDPSFLTYYFDLIQNAKRKMCHITDYRRTMQYIVQTDEPRFWKLYKKYDFSIRFGRHRTEKMLINKESFMKYGYEKRIIFQERHLLKAALKLGIQKEFLLRSYLSNINDCISSHQLKNVICRMPKNQIFCLLHELYKMRYGEELSNYLQIVESGYLPYFSTNEREIILDTLEKKDNWLQYYPINRVFPIIKEKLKSANDMNTRHELIDLLYHVCDTNQDENGLLESLSLLYERYKNDTQALCSFMYKVTNWKNSYSFTDQHWELIYNIIEYLQYSEAPVAGSHFFERYFIWLIDHNMPTDDILDKYVKEANQIKNLICSAYLAKSSKHMKILLKEVHLRIHEGHYYFQIYIDFLQLAVEFNKKFPDQIDILDYIYILDMAANRNKQTGQEFYFIKYYNKNGSMNKYLTIFDGCHHIQNVIVMYIVEHCPEEIDRFYNLHVKVSHMKKEKDIRSFLLCPHFVQKYLKDWKELAIKQLLDNQESASEFLLNFVKSDETFLSIIEKFEPSVDAKIVPQTDRIYVLKQQMIIKCLPDVSNPKNMELIRKFCKADYLKYALGSLYKICYESPQVLLPQFLQDIFRAAVSVRKHSLFLGRHLLSTNLYFEYLQSASKSEKNMSLRNILLKKCLEYYIETLNQRFFELFENNLEKIDRNDRDIYVYLINHSKIPSEVFARYVTIVYENIATNEDSDIREMRFFLIEKLPDYVIDSLDLEFMKRYLREANFGTTSFIKQCLFHTTGEKHDQIYAFIFDMFANKLNKCDLTSISERNSISRAISNISKSAVYFKYKNVIGSLDNVCKMNLPQHRFITMRLLIDFSSLFLKSDENMKGFVKNIKTHLSEFVKTYSLASVGLYVKELKLFLDNNGLDNYIFIKEFLEGSALDEINCFIAITFLPKQLPTTKNAFAVYIPILESLRSIENPIVIAHLDVYYTNTRVQSRFT